MFTSGATVYGDASPLLVKAKEAPYGFVVLFSSPLCYLGSGQGGGGGARGESGLSYCMNVSLSKVSNCRRTRDAGIETERRLREVREYRGRVGGRKEDRRKHRRGSKGRVL